MTVSSANEDSYQCDAIISSASSSPLLSTANKHLNEHTHLWFYQHQDVLQAHKLKKHLQGNSCLKSRPPLCSKLSPFALQPVHRRGGPATSIRLSNLSSSTHPKAQGTPLAVLFCVCLSLSLYILLAFRILHLQQHL